LQKSTNRYVSYLCGKHIGYFSTPGGTFKVYKIEKEKHIKIMTNKYKAVLDACIYNSLMNYRVLITD